MSIFKNANETAYVGGRKHWTDVIKNSGDGDLLLWRQPEEDFNTNSTLIVMPGEAALFVDQGKIEQVFAEAGTYKLSTKNYPFISRFRNMFSGGVSVFSAVVYFVRTAVSAELLWGTAAPIQVRDKLLGVETRVRARGSYQVQVADPAAFLEKLIGNNVPYQTQQELDRYFASQFQGKIVSMLTRELNGIEGELLGVASRMEAFAQALRPEVTALLEQYGLACVSFTLSGLEIADDELRRRYDEIGMDAIAQLRRAQAQKKVMETLGPDWERQKQVDILQAAAENPGAAGTGAGLGLGLAGMAAVGGMAGQLLGGAEKDPAGTLKQLKELLDAGLITQQEFDEKKKEVLARL